MAHKLRLLRLPAPWTVYLQEGALTENHVRQLATLEGIYGSDLIRPLEWLDGYPWGDPEDAAFELLVAIRPEETPVAYPIPPSPVMVAACDRFAKYVLQHTASVPQWVVAGFWWASLAVRYEFPVATLAFCLRAWRERFDHAVLWWNLAGKRRQPQDIQDRDECSVWWAYRTDLRHSGALAALEHELSPLLLGAHSRVEELSSWILPSAYQRGHLRVPDRWRFPDE